MLPTGVSANFSSPPTPYGAKFKTEPGEAASIKIGVWSWRSYPAGFLAGSPQEIEALVYDSSDQVALPFQSRTADWFLHADQSGYSNSAFIHPEKAENPEMFEKHISVKKIDVHFYIVSAKF